MTSGLGCRRGPSVATLRAVAGPTGLNKSVMVSSAMRTRKAPGETASAGAQRRAARSAAYRAERARVAEFHAVAKLVIHRRTVLGITQRELARRIGTKETAISRLESGRHATNVRTLRRVFEALGGHLVVGYESAQSTAHRPRRELVAV